MAIEVLNNGCDLNSIVGNGLRENGLVRLVSNEGAAVLVENETSWLATRGKSHLHLSLVDLVNVTVGADCKEVTLRVLSGAVEGDSQLEKFFKVCLRSVSH